MHINNIIVSRYLPARTPAGAETRSLVTFFQDKEILDIATKDRGQLQGQLRRRDKAACLYGHDRLGADGKYFRQLLLGHLSFLSLYSNRVPHSSLL